MTPARKKRTDGGEPPDRGETAPPVPLDPRSLPPHPEPPATPGRPRAAPAPLSPLSHEEIERLKSDAAKSPRSSPTPGQSDPSTRKKDG